uniref:Uncharacterized protein n=1 Tax=Romanomermis culicivorax TaxID=13658 RepID=A0A915JX71_ROMCU
MIFNSQDRSTARFTNLSSSSIFEKFLQAFFNELKFTSILRTFLFTPAKISAVSSFLDNSEPSQNELSESARTTSADGWPSLFEVEKSNIFDDKFPESLENLRCKFKATPSSRSNLKESEAELTGTSGSWKVKTKLSNVPFCCRPFPT